MTDLAIIPEATPTATSLALPDDMHVDDFADVCVPVLRSHNASMWWIGDLLVYAEDHYTDPEDQAQIRRLLERSGASDQTLKAARWVARVIPADRRVEMVPWWHHYAVAGLPADAADRILRSALRDGLSQREVRAAVSRLTAIDAPSDDGEPTPPADPSRWNLLPTLADMLPTAKNARDFIRRLDEAGWVIVRKDQT
jgi:hypothetical protein